jgi:D-aspartate ligase
MPTYGGTLAAVRSVGRAGVPATVAGSEVLAAARWSRYATRRVSCPSPRAGQPFLDWLMAFGDREPKHVLYASSDDLAFLFARNAAELEKRFWLYQPPIDALVRVLDKKRLLAACASVGLAGVPTWFPEDEGDLPRIAREARFPVLLKTRTQVLRVNQCKGIVVGDPEELLRSYRRFLADHRFLPGLEPHFDDVRQPMIQQYFPHAGEAIYSVTGFLDRAGDLWTARASVKVLQRTRPVGLGLGFEAAPLDASLAESVRRLCREVGHFGVFEVEFLLEGDRAMPIDFNPRFYGQMGFDAARGMPLALMAYFGASGNSAALRECIAQAEATEGGPAIYTHRFVFELFLLAQRLRLGGTPADYGRWRRWYDENRGRAVDASADAFDWPPALIHAAAELAPGLNFLRKLVKPWRAARHRASEGVASYPRATSRRDAFVD